MDSSYSDVILRPGGGRRCRVLFSYSPQNDDELELQVNDEIDFLAEIEDGWWRGMLRNKIGVFPSNFVCEIPPTDESGASEGEISAPLSSPDSTNMDAPILPPKPVKETCRVLFPYDADNDDELTLKKDDIITIITKEVEDKGWWKGELRGKIGLFPDNFVELIPQAEDSAPMQKKPDRPTKVFEKIDSKIPLVSSVTVQKKVHDVVVSHKQDKQQEEEKMAGLKGEGPFNKKNVQNAEKSSKGQGTGGGNMEKNLNLFQIKPDTVTSHRKSLEMKANENHSPPIAGKKPVLPPPLSSKPKPASGKPNQVKRLSGDIRDIVDNPNLKRLSGEAQDFIDGGTGSKFAGSNRPLTGNEEMDLDSVERSDMLTHITASRPKAPGRRPPSKELRENDVHGFLTNGNLDACDKEKSQREWEKHKPPWVDELKSNLKSSKAPNNNNVNSNSDVKTEKKSPPTGTAKPSLKSPNEGTSPVSPSGGDSSKQSSISPVRQPGQQQQSGGVGPQKNSHGDQSWKVSELSIRFSRSEKAKTPTSPTKPIVENSKHSNSEHGSDDSSHVSRRDFNELQSKVDYLEELVTSLVGSLREEIEKRKILEKELNKLTNLVTQV